MTPWVHRSSFQARLTGLVAIAVGVAVALAAVGSYFAVSHQLRSQVSNNLKTVVTHLPEFGATPSYLESRGVEAEAFTSNGTPVAQRQFGASGQGQKLPGLPHSKNQLAMAGQPGRILFSTWHSSHGSYRLATTPVTLDTGPPENPAASTQPGILVISQSLGPMQHSLATLKLILLLVALGGILLALGLGRVVAGTTIRPVKRLTRAAEHVAATQQLDATIEVESDDELGRLAHAFNQMLSALGASRQQQAQLVSDAGHELRTPLTSLRTNVELLVKARNLPETDRVELLGDVTAQLEELTTLIGDLVEMARQDEQQPEPTEIRLDSLVEHAIERAQRRAPSLQFNVSLTPGSVRAQPALLERAVLNVLDNAAKWSPAGSAVDVSLTRHDRWTLEVRDHGPGIAVDDLEKVFDRFYRAPTARSMPGSGLGLAIVSQVVTLHGGAVTAVLPPDGGTLMRIELPIVVEQEPTPALPPPPSSPPPVDPANGDRPLPPAPSVAPADRAQVVGTSEVGGRR